MTFAAVLLALLLAGPAAAGDERPSDSREDDDAPSQPESDPAETPSDHPDWTATRWLTEYYDHQFDAEADNLLELLEQASEAPGLTDRLTQRIAAELGYLAKKEGRFADAVRGFEGAVEGPNPSISHNAEAELPGMRARALEEATDDEPAAEDEPSAGAEDEPTDPPAAATDPAPSEASSSEAETENENENENETPSDPPATRGERAGWTAAQWLTEFYARKKAGDVTGLRELLDAAATAPGQSRDLDQRIAAEAGYQAKTERRLEDAARAFAKATGGPDDAVTANAKAELFNVLAELLQRGRDERQASLFDESLDTFALAETLGADPDLVAEERTTTEERRTFIAEGGQPEPATIAVSWGKAPAASEALSDPVPPPLVDEPWLEEFAEERDDGADIETLEMILDDLEQDEDPQRIAIERGYLALDDGDPLAAGRAFLAAQTGEDEGLSTRATAELLKLQRHFRNLAVQNTHLGDIARADTAFRTAEALGADRQFMQYERSYIAGLDGDEEKVAELLAAASEGPNEAVGTQAAYELAARTGIGIGGPPESQEHILAYIEHRDAERFDEADAELDLAEEKGANSQLIELYRAYLDKAKKDDFAARKHLREVANGEDEDLAKQARAELRYTAKPVWADLYGEGFGWARVWPEDKVFDDFTGTVRVRGYLHPFQKIAFDPYIFFQLSGDVRSRQDGGPTFGGGPLIYADNSAMLGGGLLLRVWKHRITFWGQVAAAFPWVKLATASDVQLDVQAGAAISFSSEGCRPPDGKPAYVAAHWCAEFYGDTVYRNRPYHNLFFSARGRVGLHYLVTGPVAWAPIIEARFSKDVIDDYWANLIDFGLMHRWRLMSPLGIDVVVGVHSGTLLGLYRDTPPPANLGYIDFRLQLSAYVAF